MDGVCNKEEEVIYIIFILYYYYYYYYYSSSHAEMLQKIQSMCAFIDDIKELRF